MLGKQEHREQRSREFHPGLFSARKIAIFHMITPSILIYACGQLNQLYN